MIRRFRAIIQTNKEPEDHEVIWKKGHKLLYWNNGWRPIYEFEASEIIYESKDTGEEISLEDAVNEVKDSVANVKITAEQALEISRVAEGEAGNATTKANQANTKADKAITDSKAASDKATEAVNKATDATNVANTAEQTANTANETAGQAMTKSTQALEKSDKAIEDAKNSLSEAQTAHTLAENAQNVADANTKKLAGITLKPISETEYEALETKENNTLYLCYDPSDEP